MAKTRVPYEDLANAIVFQAVRDYQSALCGLHWNPNDKKMKELRFETEAFLKGFTLNRRKENGTAKFSHKLHYTDYIGSLTEVDGDTLIEMAEKQIENAGYSMATLSSNY